MYIVGQVPILGNIGAHVNKYGLIISVMIFKVSQITSQLHPLTHCKHVLQYSVHWARKIGQNGPKWAKVPQKDLKRALVINICNQRFSPNKD